MSESERGGARGRDLGAILARGQPGAPGSGMDMVGMDMSAAAVVFALLLVSSTAAATSLRRPAPRVPPPAGYRRRSLEELRAAAPGADGAEAIGLSLSLSLSLPFFDMFYYLVFGGRDRASRLRGQPRVPRSPPNPSPPLCINIYVICSDRNPSI